MIDFFDRPWEISGRGRLIDLPITVVNPQMELVKVGDEMKSFHDMRRHKYERIIEETLYIARASEGEILSG